MISQLCLSVPAYGGPDSWRWTLSDNDGNFVGDHEVNLDAADWQRAAVRDLYDYVAAKGGGSRDAEARIIADVGDWIGERILGSLGPKLIGASPSVVTVTVPGSAGELALVPLECARVDGHPLRLRGVSLVTASARAASAAGPPDVIDDKLRVLAIFPSHPGDPSLNQRKERRFMDRMVKRIGATWNKAVEFRALQYGVTSQDLRDVVEEAPGWDIVHVSGYAAPGLLRLARDPRGSAGAEPVALADILDLTRGRLKLVTISACVSSAAVAAEEIEIPGQSASGRTPAAGDEWLRAGLPVAMDLAERLGCAVATVRFPIPDDFAFDYFHGLYWRLIARSQPLTRAVELVLSDFYSRSSGLGVSALSLASPVLLGRRAVDIRLAAPDGALQPPDPGIVKLASFDVGPPERFVGRDDVMREASGALADDSGKSGVLLYGMPGAGKTACALELAYTRDSLDYDNTFPIMIWYQVTSDPQGNIATALEGFAKVLDHELGSFPLSGVLADEHKLAAELPRMTEYFENRRVLVVLDNIETLLQEGGGWRDGRWGLVIGALTNHSGFGRILLTSRQVPAVLDRRVLTLPVGPLDRDDTLLLARDLGPLRALLDGSAPGMAADEARELGSRVLSATRGHPYLLGLANAAIGDMPQLEELLDAAAEVWPSAPADPVPPVRADSAQGKGAAYVRLLEAWAVTIITALTTEARAFFQVLCCMDEPDRVVPVIADNWAELSALIGPASASPPLPELVDLLRERGLVTTEVGEQNAVTSVQVHPVLAEQGRGELGDAMRLAIDAQLAGYWARRAAAGETSAGISASSYLARLDESGNAQQVLEQVFLAGGPPSGLAVQIVIERAMLRRAYEASVVSRIAERHRQLSAHLAQAGENQQGLAHMLAAALLYGSVPDGDRDARLESAVAELWGSGGGTLPGSLAQLSAGLEADGAALAGLAGKALGDPDRVEGLLGSIVARVRAASRPKEDP